jgi:DNA-binding GntR family transcriptional regulator
VLVPGIEQVDFSSTSLYVQLEERYGIRPARARFTVEAVSADARAAELLDLDPGLPLLRCRQLTEDDSGRLIEVCEMAYRGDRYRFRATMVRGTAGEASGDGAAATPAG